MNYTDRMSQITKEMRKRLGLKPRKMLAERPQYWLYERSIMLTRIESKYAKQHTNTVYGIIALLLTILFSCY